MKKSLFTTLDIHPEIDAGLPEKYAEALGQAVLADELGFDSFWIGEHHFRPIGTVPNPAVLLAAVAARTRRIRLGPAVSVLAMRDPILIAEDYAMLDIISRGRLNMGVGTGSQAAEFKGMGLDYEGRREAFAANLTVVLERWAAARDGQSTLLNVCPRQARPPIYVATMSLDGAYQAGRAGHSMLALSSPATENLAELQAMLNAHERGFKESKSAGTAEAVCAFFAHVGRTEAEAMDEAAAALGRFITLAQGNSPADPRGLCETMKDRNTGLFGTDKQVCEQLASIESIGCGHVAFLANFGGMRGDVVERSIRSLAAAFVGPAGVPVTT